MGQAVHHDRLRGALWGMFVGDALAMPVHWYYGVAAVQRDFGTVSDYQAPSDYHPSSIMSLSSTGAAGGGSQQGEVVGSIILHGKKHLWGRPKRYLGGMLHEWRLRAGSGVSAPAQTLRLIRFKKGHKVYELSTNVLDSKRLTGEESLAAYSCRWRVERMYFDLKEVLDLNRFYPANPNAVGM